MKTLAALVLLTLLAVFGVFVLDLTLVINLDLRIFIIPAFLRREKGIGDREERGKRPGS